MKKKVLVILLLLLFLVGIFVFWKNNNKETEVLDDEPDIIDVEPDISDPSSDGTYDSNYSFKDKGSADNINGTTIIVSIFANDSTTSWNKSSSEDQTMMSNIREYLGVGTTWLMKSTMTYGASSKFIYDWSKYTDLYYETSFDDDMIVSDLSKISLQYEYIENNVKTGELLNKYNADNIIYLFYFNTDYANKVHTWTYQHNYRSDYEVINVFVRYEDKFVLSASSYAHEILHCFGAPDLYYKNSKITQEYVDYLKSINSDDILYSVDDVGTITKKFTELDAYYVGLTSTSSDVTKYGLGKSEYDS